MGSGDDGSDNDGYDVELFSQDNWPMSGDWALLGPLLEVSIIKNL